MTTLKVVIMSGVPGAGKSTWIEDNRHGIDLVCSADSFFIQPDGKYEYNSRQINEAHGHSLRTFIDAVQNRNSIKETVIVVDNTNTTSEEIAPYYAVARAYGAEIVLLTFMGGDPKEMAERNVYGVPETTIRRMQERLNNRVLPGHWNINCFYI